MILKIGTMIDDPRKKRYFFIAKKRRIFKRRYLKRQKGTIINSTHKLFFNEIIHTKLKSCPLISGSTLAQKLANSLITPPIQPPTKPPLPSSTV